MCTDLCASLLHQLYCLKLTILCVQVELYVSTLYVKLTWKVPVWYLLTVTFKSKLTVCWESRCSMLNSQFLCELRIKMRVESLKTENKRFTHDWFVDNFTLTYRDVTKISSCQVNTTSRQGIKQLGISFGSIFPWKKPGATFIVAGENPGPHLLMTALT